MILYPIRPDRIAALGDRWTAPGHAVTSGAFVPTSHERDYRWTLERNPHDPLRDRSPAQPGVERMELYCIPEKSTALNLFMTGELDMVLEFLPLAIPSMRDHPGYATAPKLEVRYVAFRLDEGPTSERLLRQALAQALDRSELPRVLRGGQLPTTSWLPPGMFGHDPTTGLPFDPQAARAALAASRHASEGAAAAAPLRLLLRSGDDWRLMGENVQEQWRRVLGLSIPLEVREQRVFFQELASDAAPPMHLARWVADFPDPENFMGMFRSDSGHNTLRLRSERYDTLVNQAVLTTDSAERARLYSQAQRELLIEEVAMAPLYVNAQNHLVNPALAGVELNAMGDLSLRHAAWPARGGQA